MTRRYRESIQSRDVVQLNGGGGLQTIHEPGYT